MTEWRGVYPFPKRHDPELTYKQLASHLRVSERFLRGCIREGLPAHWDWSCRKQRPGCATGRSSAVAEARC
jgi:hypothetical protein